MFSDFNASDVIKIKSITKEPIWRVRFNISNVSIHFIGEKITGEYVSKLLAGRLFYINKIPCFTLDAEAQAYEETKREYKAELIRDFLKKK